MNLYFAIYVGETHRTWGDRLGDHLKALREHNLKYGIVKHMKEFHQSQEPNFHYEVKTPYKSTIERQISEAIMLQTLPRDTIMNSKSEWGYNFLPQQVSTQRDFGQAQRPGTGDKLPQNGPKAEQLGPKPSTDTSQSNKYNVLNNPDDFFNSQLNQIRKKLRLDRTENTEKYLSLNSELKSMTVNPATLENVALRTEYRQNSHCKDRTVKLCSRHISKSRTAIVFREGSRSQPSIFKHFSQINVQKGQTHINQGGTTKRGLDGQLKDQ